MILSDLAPRQGYQVPDMGYLLAFGAPQVRQPYRLQRQTKYNTSIIKTTTYLSESLTSVFKTGNTTYYHF